MIAVAAGAPVHGMNSMWAGQAPGLVSSGNNSQGAHRL